MKRSLIFGSYCIALAAARIFADFSTADVSVVLQPRYLQLQPKLALRSDGPYRLQKRGDSPGRSRIGSLSKQRGKSQGTQHQQQYLQHISSGLAPPHHQQTGPSLLPKPVPPPDAGFLSLQHQQGGGFTPFQRQQAVPLPFTQHLPQLVGGMSIPSPYRQHPIPSIPPQHFPGLSPPIIQNNVPRASTRHNPGPSTSVIPPYSRPFGQKPVYEAVSSISIRGQGTIQHSSDDNFSFEAAHPGTVTHRANTHPRVTSAGGQTWAAPHPQAAGMHPSNLPVQAEAFGNLATATVQAPMGGYGHVQLDAPGHPSQVHHVLSGESKSFSVGPSWPSPARVKASASDGTYVHVVGHNPPI